MLHAQFPGEALQAWPVRAASADDQGPSIEFHQSAERQSHSLPGEQASHEQGCWLWPTRRGACDRSRPIKDHVREDDRLFLMPGREPRTGLGILHQDQIGAPPGQSGQRIGIPSDGSRGSPRRLEDRTADAEHADEVPIHPHAPTDGSIDEWTTEERCERPQPCVRPCQMPDHIEGDTSGESTCSPEGGHLPKEVVEPRALGPTLPGARPLRQVDVFEVQSPLLRDLRKSRLDHTSVALSSDHPHLSEAGKHARPDPSGSGLRPLVGFTRIREYEHTHLLSLSHGVEQGYGPLVVLQGEAGDPLES